MQDLNIYGVVPSSLPQTSQYAALCATTTALDTTLDLMNAGEDFNHVIIKTDSEYLSKGLSPWVWKWSRNGYKNWRWQPVVNGRACKCLHERVELLENDYGIDGLAQFTDTLTHTTPVQATGNIFFFWRLVFADCGT